MTIREQRAPIAVSLNSGVVLLGHFTVRMGLYEKAPLKEMIALEAFPLASLWHSVEKVKSKGPAPPRPHSTASWPLVLWRVCAGKAVALCSKVVARVGVRRFATVRKTVLRLNSQLKRSYDWRIIVRGIEMEGLNEFSASNFCNYQVSSTTIIESALTETIFVF